MTDITAKVIADSIEPILGERVTTLELRFPRFILAQTKNHRACSSGAASSRAIPTIKLFDRVLNDPALPIRYTLNQRGMVGDDAIPQHIVDGIVIDFGADPNSPGRRIETTGLDDAFAEIGVHVVEMLSIINDAVKKACGAGPHKQHINRYLEPWLHTDMVMTAPEWAFEHLFALRVAHDAQPEFQALAQAMYDAMQASTPREVRPGDWHVPYYIEGEPVNICAQLYSPARCARVSYTTHGTENIDRDKDRNLTLFLKKNKHATPFEHQLLCRGIPSKTGLYKSFQPLREQFEELGRLKFEGKTDA